MIVYGYSALTQFPKSEKFALAVDIKHCMHLMLGYTIEVQIKEHKKTTVRDLDIENHRLQSYLRLAYTLKFLPSKKYEVWSKLSIEIGRMIGGLKKSVYQ